MINEVYGELGGEIGGGAVERAWVGKRSLKGRSNFKFDDMSK